MRSPQRDELTALYVYALTEVGEAARAIEAADAAIDVLDQAGLPVGPRLRDARRAAHRVPGTHPAPSPLRMLPTDTRAFTGRESELAKLLDLAENAYNGEAPGTVVISAIDGMGGIGKTALAIHAGHRLIQKFPDGQLFVDLHGYTNDLPPATAFDVLGGFLQAFEIPPQLIPDELDGRAALYRDRLANKRMLIVLDNVNSEAQVTPLLPGNDGCLVVVTSRLRLTNLLDAHVLSLDLLPTPDAITLFRRVAGPGRVPANDPLLEEIADLCGRLPLTLCIAAALLRHHPSWTLNHLAAQLQDQKTRVASLDDGDRQLASVLSLSYANLSERQKHLFRYLALIPGPDTDVYATAALIDTDLHIADDLLGGLYTHNLIAEPIAGRYQCHDLVRAHARTLTPTEDSTENCAIELAIERLLSYYRDTSAVAAATINSGTGARASLYAPEISSREMAMTWLRAERGNLLACRDYVDAHGIGEMLVSITSGLAPLLRIDGPWHLALNLHAKAAEVARDLNEPHAEANAFITLGIVQQLTGDYGGAIDTFEQALMLCRELGYLQGEAKVLNDMGAVWQLIGDFVRAGNAQGQALTLYREVGDRQGEANALNRLGMSQRMTGDYGRAIDTFEQALTLCRELGHRQGEAGIYINLGAVCYATGDYAAATSALEQALTIYRELADRQGEANALNTLGIVRQLTGDYGRALEAVERALMLCRELGHRQGEANALNNLGAVWQLTGDYGKAADSQEQALALYREVGDRQGEANALNYLGTVWRQTAEHSRAIDSFDKALIMYRELGDRQGEAEALTGLAAVLIKIDKPIEADMRYRNALRLAREIDSPIDEAAALEGIGECRLRKGDNISGLAYLQQALAIYRQLEVPGIARVEARISELGFG